MSTRTNVAEMTGQGFVHGVFSLINPQIGTTRNGDPFLKCLLRDATGDAIGRMWRFDPTTMPDVTSTGFVRIEGAQEMYQDKLQIKIGEIKKKKLVSLVDEINKIINDNHIKGIVIGNPINMDGSVGKSSKSALEFAKNLSKNITIPITMWDERLSSEGSFKITKELNTNVSNRVNKLDKNAAAFILQGAIDYLSN